MQISSYAKKPFKSLRHCIQRIRRGYCDADLWDMDGWFLWVIVPMLRQFSETIPSLPMWLYEQCIAETEYESGSDELNKICYQKWKIILNELADKFEKLESLYDDDSGTFQQQEALKNECFKRFSEYFFELYL